MALFEDTFPPYVPFGSRTLHLASPRLRGTDVAVLQAVYDLMLATMNPPQGPIGSPIPIDGEFGPTTRQAVAAIQSYFGLNADGVVGPDTYFLFGQGVGPHTTYGGPVYGSRELTQGANGGDVRILQNRLNCFRYASLIGQPATGTFDAATAQAVLAFKRDAAQLGDVGFPNNAVAGSGFYDASWLYTFAGGRALFPGRNGFDVVFVQVVLKGLGLYSGPVHGYYDEATRSAVVAFQTAEGIGADGIVGPATFYHIGLRNAVPIPGPLGVSWPPSPPPGPWVDCCALLTPPIPFANPEGGSLWLRQQRTGAYQLVATAVNLPAPNLINPAFTGYFLTFLGNVLPMTEVDASAGVWQVAFAAGTGAPLPGSTVFTVQPGSDPQHLGPPLIGTSLDDCRS